MAHKVIWTERAVEDLVAACEFISRDSPAYASALADNAYLGAARLAEFPNLGRQVPERRNPSLREIIIDSYRVVYLVSETTIHIVRVSHCARVLKL